MSQQDLLRAITMAAAKARDITEEITAMELAIKERSQQLRAVTHEELPDLMAQANLRDFTLDSDGNHPAYKLAVKPYARASIAADWPEARRAEAFQWLTTNGHGDLIKVVVAVEFPREAHATAMELAGRLQAEGMTIVVRETVHHATLSKWLKEAIGRGQIVPLDVIGGDVGREATLKLVTT